MKVGDRVLTWALKNGRGPEAVSCVGIIEEIVLNNRLGCRIWLLVGHPYEHCTGYRSSDELQVLSDDDMVMVELAGYGVTS